MKKIMLLVAVIFAILVAGFISATPPAPSPTCQIKGIIQSVEFREAYNESCLSNCDREGYAACCPTDMEYEHPARYFLNISIDEAKYFSGENQYSKCDEIYPINSEKIIKINKEDVKKGDSFLAGQIIEGKVSYYSFISYTLTKDCKNLYWFDNSNKSCGQKEFCGAYMYQGLRTFESKMQCENALSLEINLTLNNKTLNKNQTDNKTSNNNQNKTFHLSNGRNAEIKIMPETASARAVERLGELNFTIQLKEVGKGDDAKPVYELAGDKQGKFLGIFKIMARVQAQVDAETGEVKIIKPWWSFLASGI